MVIGNLLNVHFWMASTREKRVCYRHEGAYTDAYTDAQYNEWDKVYCAGWEL